MPKHIRVILEALYALINDIDWATEEEKIILKDFRDTFYAEYKSKKK